MRCLLTKCLFYYVCSRINSLPRINSGQPTSAREQFRGIKFDYKKDTSLSFGQYVQVYCNNNVSNSLVPRSTGALALGPKDNSSNGWLFLNLNTGKTFTSSKWEICAMDDLVVDHINNLDAYFNNMRSKNSNTPPPLIDLSNLQHISNDVHDNENVDTIDQIEVIPNADLYALEDEIDIDIDIDIADNDIIDTFPAADVENIEFNQIIDNTISATDRNSVIETSVKDNNESNMNNVDHGPFGTIEIDGERRSARLNKSYISFNLSVRHAKNVYGILAEEAIAKEINQMIDKGVFEFVDSVPGGVNVLNSHMFLKLKSNGILKARLVAGGNNMDKTPMIR